MSHKKGREFVTEPLCQGERIASYHPMDGTNVGYDLIPRFVSLLNDETFKNLKNRSNV
jgi:hypothetical protein